MRVVASSLIAAGTVAGVAGAVLAYQSAASVADPRPAASVVQKPAPAQVRYLPCEPGTHLVSGACVRVERRVVVHQVPAAIPARPAPAPSVGDSGSGDESAPPTSDDADETEPAEEPEHADESDGSEDTEHEDEGVESESEAQDD